MYNLGKAVVARCAGALSKSFLSGNSLMESVAASLGLGANTTVTPGPASSSPPSPPGPHGPPGPSGHDPPRHKAERDPPHKAER